MVAALCLGKYFFAARSNFFPNLNCTPKNQSVFASQLWGDYVLTLTYIYVHRRGQNYSWRISRFFSNSLVCLLVNQKCFFCIKFSDLIFTFSRLLNNFGNFRLCTLLIYLYFGWGGPGKLYLLIFKFFFGRAKCLCECVF